MPFTTIDQNSGNILATKNEPLIAAPAPVASVGRLLNALAPGTFKTLQKVQPSGALQARKSSSNAISFFWRYSIGTKSERVPIGLYDPSAPPKSLTATAKGFSVAAAIRAAEGLALEHHDHRLHGGRPALLETKRKADEAAARRADKVGKHTLENLLDHYADHLERLGRRSHRDVRSIFQLHVKGPWPDVARLPAKEVTGEQIGDMMRRVADAGKGRTANKLRSYVRAAYQTARASRSKASVPVHFKDYEITHNPAMDTEPDESQNRAKKQPLLEDDMRRYWQQINSMRDFKGAVLRLHVLTGGQRIEQLVKLHTEHIKTDEILLFDGKGRPGKGVRENLVPLLPVAVAALAECKPSGVFAISTDGGETHLAATTLSQWAKDVASEAGIKNFQAKRIRSGVETLLAKAGVSQEIRGRLQSHGISGVQARHYDGHDYMEEQRVALRTLFNVLTSIRPSKTRPAAAKPLG
ncbi:integrase [Variovorax sp. RO1]|uniref:integrase n=1 Tax=Variovorax sp. RO1 TaxID=2066034 RepID=UPI00215172AD|nr:integrase [Variovorax sp. RO1]